MFRPLRKSEDGHPGLQFLQEAIVIFEKWKKSRNAGLASETFMACIQTMRAVTEMVEYLQDRHGFTYVLSGKLMSDPIEGRFGWYRQSNGGNFYMSVKQVLTAEKKIRCISLLQQHGLSEASAIDELKPLPISEIEPQYDNDHRWLYEYLSSLEDNKLPETDGAVSYFVAGYIGCSIYRRRKCEDCKKMLLSSDNVPETPDGIPKEYKTILEMANRGGLSEPTEYCLLVTARTVQLYTAIVSYDVAMENLMRCNNQRSVFVQAVQEVFKSSPMLMGYLQAECAQNHANFHYIVQIAFNCFARNELKRLNGRPVAGDMPGKNLRKIRKLTSKSSCKQ